MRGAILFALIFLSRTASAAEWEVVSIMGEYSGFVEVDASSIVTVGKFHKAWFKWTNTEPQKMPVSVRAEYSVDTYHVQISLEYFNCAERTSATVQSVYRNKEGGVVGSGNIPAANASYVEVVPESVGESMLERVCAKTKPPQEKPAPAAKVPQS